MRGEAAIFYRSLDRTFILPGLMVKMDMASMAASLEARSPLLDHKYSRICCIIAGLI